MMGLGVSTFALHAGRTRREKGRLMSCLRAKPTRKDEKVLR